MPIGARADRVERPGQRVDGRLHGARELAPQYPNASTTLVMVVLSGLTDTVTGSRLTSPTIRSTAALTKRGRAGPRAGRGSGRAASCAEHRQDEQHSSVPMPEPGVNVR